MRGENSSARGGVCAGAVRLLCNHNPFYVISAVLVLYGLRQMTSGGEGSLTGGWLLFGLLCGYSLLLAGAAWLIIRLGQVWQDARTILLLLVLLFAAISISFDEIALSDSTAGAGFLALGFVFAVLVSEGLLRALRMRLPLLYRGPYYAILLLLFAWPIPLAELSIRGHEEAMSWGVFLFPWVGGLLLLTLLPAARWGRSDKRPSGTPWPWPLYPWSLFAFLWVCLMLRTVSLSMAFEMTGPSGTSFSPYFLLPLVVAWSAVLWELGVAGRVRWVQRLALAAPLGMLLFAFPASLPWAAGDVIEQMFLARLCATVAAPVQLTILTLLAWYGYAWIRGSKPAEALLVGVVLLAAVVDRATVTIGTLTEVNPLPWELLAFAQIALSAATRVSWRMIAGCAIGVMALSCRFWDFWIVETSGYLPLNLMIVAVLLASILFDDRLARTVRRMTSRVIPAAAAFAVLAYGWLFPNVPSWFHVQYTAVLAALSAGTWYRRKTVPQLAAAAGTFALWAVGMLKKIYLLLGSGAALARGRDWLMWGLVLLGVALFISLYKGGSLREMRRRVYQLNAWLAGARRREAVRQPAKT